MENLGHIPEGIESMHVARGFLHYGKKCELDADAVSLLCAIEEDEGREAASRREALEYALLEEGLPFRKDSKICRSFVQAGPVITGQNIEEIVETMTEMEFLYKQTEYPAINRVMFKSMLDTEKTLSGGHRISNFDVERVREVARIVSKSMALQDYCDTCHKNKHQCMVPDSMLA